MALCIRECVHLILILARAGLKLNKQCQLALAKDLPKLKCFFSAIFLCICEYLNGKDGGCRLPGLEEGAWKIGNSGQKNGLTLSSCC